MRPGSDFDKLRKKQEARVAEVARKQYEQRLLFQYRKRRRAEAEQQAQEQADLKFEAFLEEAAEELAIEDAREEIRRDRR